MAKEAATAQNGRRVKNSCLEVNLATISKEEVNRTRHQIPFRSIIFIIFKIKISENYAIVFRHGSYHARAPH